VDELQELYFAGYAFWDYFTAPFLLAQSALKSKKYRSTTRTVRPGDSSA
jgi:hypothetical protein